MNIKEGIWTIQISVTDDKHVQPHQGVNVWKGDNIQLAFRISGQSSLWTAGLTLLANGKPELYLWDLPLELLKQPPLQSWKLEARRSGTRTEYEVRIPLSSIGVTTELLKLGISFNVLINDNDGFGRESFIAIGPGIGESKDPSRYPVVKF